MSTRHLPYPSDFEVNHTAAIHEERRRRALQSLDVGDVISAVEDALATAAEPGENQLQAIIDEIDRTLAALQQLLAEQDVTAPATDLA